MLHNTQNKYLNLPHNETKYCNWWSRFFRFWFRSLVPAKLVAFFLFWLYLFIVIVKLFVPSACTTFSFNFIIVTLNSPHVLIQTERFPAHHVCNVMLIFKTVTWHCIRLWTNSPFVIAFPFIAERRIKKLALSNFRRLHFVFFSFSGFFWVTPWGSWAALSYL